MAFAVNGFVYANWTSRLPRLQELYDIDNGQTGFVLTGLALGALIAMPTAGYLIVKNGSRRLLIWSSICYVLVAPLLAFMPNYWGLLLVMPVIGMGTGVMDVAMNAQAVEVERVWGTPITSSFHACFSGGMFLGAATAAGFIALRLDLGAHLLVVAAFNLAVVLYALRFYYHDTVEEADASVAAPSKFNLAIVLLGVAALCTMIGEGAMADWTPLYMTRVAGSSEALAPIGQAAFAGAMFVGRALGDFLRARLGSIGIVRGGALVSLIGILGAILVPLPWVAITGFALVGLGLANIIPVLFSQASKVPGLRSGVGISSVSTIGYAGFLCGPPVIGFLSDYQNSLLPEGMLFFPGVEGLRVGLGVVAVLLTVLLALGWLVLRVED